MKTTVVIQMESKAYNGFAESLALDMLSRGFDVRSVAVAREGYTSLTWQPTYLPGQRVRIEGTEGEGYLGTVLEIGTFNRFDREVVRYNVQWDDADLYGTLWCDEREILPAVAR
jgi:hypothetical protein